MRTVVNIDDDLLDRARRATGLKRKVDVVNHALARLVEQAEREEILSMAGRVAWTGDLDEMRADREVDP
jgi:Arc/MetJ family transcription regulator